MVVNMFKNNLISRVSIVALMGVMAIHSASLWADENEYDKPQTTTAICHLPDEIRLAILSHLTPKDLANVTPVSKKWHGLADDEHLSKAGFEKVASDVKTVNLSIESLKNAESCSYIDELAMLSYKEAREIQFEGLAKEEYPRIRSHGEDGYTKNLTEAVSLNDEDAATGDTEAREHQIKGLLNGTNGYTINPTEAVRLNDEYAAAGDDEARERQIKGLTYGVYGYTKNKAEAKRLNDELVAEGNPAAIRRKLEGKAFGKYGYKKDPQFFEKYINFLKGVKARENAE